LGLQEALRGHWGYFRYHSETKSIKEEYRNNTPKIPEIPNNFSKVSGDPPDSPNIL